MQNAFLLLATSGNGGWKFGQMLEAIQTTLGAYGKVIVGIIGLVMVIVSVYQIAKNLISHGKAQTNWVVTFALLLIGGVFMLSSGWGVIKSVVSGGTSTIDGLGHGQSDDANFQEPTAIIDSSSFKIFY